MSAAGPLFPRILSSYSIPTSADKEDHVSMGTIAARKARNTVKNVEQILAIEPLCATQGLEFLLPAAGSGYGGLIRPRGNKFHHYGRPGVQQGYAQGPLTDNIRVTVQSGGEGSREIRIGLWGKNEMIHEEISIQT